MSAETQPVNLAGLYQEPPASCDVAVLGAGPAGLATALALGKLAPALAVTVIDGGQPQLSLPFATLDRDAQPLLSRLGVWESFLEGESTASRGTHAAWGNEELRPHEFFFTPPRQGWRLDRRRFLALLRLFAAQEGVLLTRSTGLSHAAELRDGTGVVLEIEHTGGARSIRSRFAVDATGRPARLARQLGARKVRFDHLVGSFVVLEGEAGALEEADAFVEAHRQGWWYVARDDPGHVLAAFLTDADLARSLGVGNADPWLELFEGSAARRRLAALNPHTEPRILALHCHRLDQTAGEDWLAVGDAAATVDPLTLPGISKAMGSGIEAAEAIVDALAGRRTGIRRYRQSLAASFESLLETRRKIYEREDRFAGEPFWVRRADRVTLDPDLLLSYDESPETQARIDGLGMHLPPDELRLLCSLVISPRLSRAVVAAFEERSEWTLSRRRILLALQYLVEQGILSAE